MVVMDPAPFLPPHNVRFRRGDHEKGECSASECSLIAQDLWKAGFGRIQVVPSVQVSFMCLVIGSAAEGHSLRTLNMSLSRPGML